MITVKKDEALLNVCLLRNPRENIILVFLALTLNIGLMAKRKWAADLKERQRDRGFVVKQMVSQL